MNKTILFLSATLLSSTLIASEIQEGSWTNYAKVTSAELHDNATFRITTETTDITSHSCASANGHYWWPATDVLAKEMYSTALTALASGKQVSVVFKNECNIGSKRVTHMRVL